MPGPVDGSTRRPDVNVLIHQEGHPSMIPSREPDWFKQYQYRRHVEGYYAT